MASFSDSEGVEIVPSEEEEMVFEVLRAAAEFGGRSTVPRVAGGWVRDKLLGYHSDDIDIATDDCMGEEFAKVINSYLESRGDHVGSIGVITANPEQSKHLETATMKICGLEIDLVNLRSEEYTDSNSRIPTIRFGTPEEDAFRRDFTINSLFYNIMTKRIEDYTSRGIDDLMKGIVRTPLPALTTFTDDPLRVLRAIRFASRYKFSLDQEILSVGQLPIMRESLQKKISKERIYKELNGCFTGKLARPIRAIEMLHQMDLFAVIFCVPSESELMNHHARVEDGSIIPLKCKGFLDHIEALKITEVSDVIEFWQMSSLLNISAVNLLIQMELGNHDNALFGSTEMRDKDFEGSLFDLYNYCSCNDVAASKAASRASDVISVEEQLNSIGRSADESRNLAVERLEKQQAVAALLWAGCVSGVRDITILNAKKKATSLSNHLLFTSLKLGTNMLKSVDCILGHSGCFRMLANVLVHCGSDLVGGYSIMDFREDVGLVIRSCKENWRSSLLIACAFELAEAFYSDDIQIRINQSRILLAPVSLRCNGDPSAVSVALAKYRSLYKAIIRLELEGVWNMAPFYHGKALLKELNLPPGPIVGAVVDFQFRWQMRHPQGTKEECLDALRRRFQDKDSIIT